jgi:hypothetical protein
MSFAPFLGFQECHKTGGDTKSGKYEINMGKRFKIDVSHNGEDRQFPFVYKFGNNVFISYSEHKDAVIASPVDALMISRDNGKTWKEKQTNKDFYMTSMVEKKGKLYGIVYFTYPVSPHQEKMVYWTSEDDGKTWIQHHGVVNAPNEKQFKPIGNDTWGSILFHQGMRVMEDGSIQGVMYGHFKGDKKYSVVWVKSTDNCSTWNIMSIIASGVPEGYADAQGYCEPTFAKVEDGSILCVMRIDSYKPLFQTRSKDGGATWSKPVMLPGLSQKASQSVDPHLLFMDNGILALSYGRPSDRIAFCSDGSGYKWDKSIISYNGVTTGYTGIVEVEPNKLLLIADQGANWSQGIKEKAIWGRFININIKK